MPRDGRKPRKSVRRQATDGGRLLSFDSLYGWAYDTAISLGPLTRLGFYVQWGGDMERVWRDMRETLACVPGELVLDCPAGSGTAFAAAGRGVRGTVLAVDLSLQMLLRARDRRPARGVHLVQADAGRLPLADSTVDRAGCFMSLHCIPRKAAALAEFARVLKPGGRLTGCTLVSDAPLPWRLTVEAARRVPNFFVPEPSSAIAAHARAAGFGWQQERAGAMLYFSGVKPQQSREVA